MKKIMIAITSFYGGGAERVATVWAGRLSELGYSVSMLAFAKVEGEYETSSAVTKHYLAESVEEYKKLPFLARLKAIRGVLKKENPECVISFLPSMQVWIMLASIGLGIKRVETIRVNPWRISVSNPIYRAGWHMCYHTCDKIILQTEDQGPYFTKADQKKAVVIRNPLAEVYKNADSRKYGKGVNRFVAAGRIDPQKNFPMLIEAFSRVAKDNDTISLDIYGNGSDEYTAYLQQCIDKTGVSERIILKGRTNDMCTALMEHDCFIMSSDYEGMPNALAEAMATGMVCISTDCKTGPCDMIENGKNGYLSKTGDADDMERVIRQVLSMSKEDIESMGKAARSSILDLCDDEKNIKKLIEVIEG
ncbi:MAG: glycosyltransferase [Clostridia bacterium]|nr:glycosyltransferase [Clostridia bacterium]